jgi:hypothetical protein
MQVLLAHFQAVSFFFSKIHTSLFLNIKIITYYINIGSLIKYTSEVIDSTWFNYFIFLKLYFIQLYNNKLLAEKS